MQSFTLDSTHGHTGAAANEFQHQSRCSKTACSGSRCKHGFHSSWADEHRNPTTSPWHYVNLPADSHELMCQFHKPVDEKRMEVILPTDSYDAWLKAKPQESMDFMRTYTGELVAGSERTAPSSLLD